MLSNTTHHEFMSQVGSHRVIPVIRELFAEGETPVGIYRKLAAGRPGTFLLESADQGAVWARYSFVGISSFGALSHEAGRPVWQDYGLSQERAFGGPLPESGLSALEQLHARWATERVPGHPPLTGGLVGFIGWEAIRELEHLPNAPAAEFSLPMQTMNFVSELAVVDHRTGSVLLVVAALTDDSGSDGDELWSTAQQQLDALQTRLAQPSEAWLAEIDRDALPEPAPRVSAEQFFDSVSLSREYIRSGDVFQVVISQRFDHEVTAEPLDVYRVLRTLNPSPYMYLLSNVSPSGEPFWVVGSSPEALVKVERGHVTTHPIAGSRPRGAGAEADQALAESLLADPKERAEHLMLVDLSRNDLQKVCLPGSVAVTEFMTIERFSHIMHLVSTVEGSLDPERSPLDVFRAAFPAGTLSGAPKPRALQIIDELEPAQRGLYGGVVGYFDFAGDLDLAIAIRTTTIANGVARVQAGAGLVADSDPETEFAECHAKAAAPLRAIAIANAMNRVE